MPNLPHHFDLCREEDEHYLHIDIIVDHCQVQRVTFQKHHLIAYRDMIQERAAREIAAQEAGDGALPAAVDVPARQPSPA
jgi:hypothetical protein